MPDDTGTALTAAWFRSILLYDPESGEFTWRHRDDRDRRWNSLHAGKRAGGLLPNGYRYINISGKLYLESRLAWLMTTGEWPKQTIDHKNCASCDNRFVNLREASNRQNSHNQRLRRDSTSGRKGVSWFSQTNRWRAVIKDHGRYTHLGYFLDIEDAAAAYTDAARNLFGEFARVA